MNTKANPLIPFGNFCYRIERIPPGEVLRKQPGKDDRWGKDQRVGPYRPGL